MKRSAETRNILYLAAAALTALILLGLFLALAQDLAPALRARLGRKADSAPLFKQARALGLTYEAALAAPAAALGKPAVWCLRKPKTGPAQYGGDPSRPVIITNPAVMPDDIYSYARVPCREALVTITSVRINELYGSRSIQVEAQFVDYP